MNETPVAKQNLANELLDIIGEAYISEEDVAMLLEMLVMFITQRDIKIWNRAYKLGKESHER